MDKIVNRYNFTFRLDQASQAPLDPVTGIPVPNSVIYNVGSPALSIQKPGNYYECQITNICLPFSFNVINPNNNKVINNIMTINGTPHTFDITMPPGNYSATQFCSTFQQILQAEYLSISPSGTALFSLPPEQIEGTVIISVTLGNESSISLFLNFGYNSLSTGNDYIGDVLGFPKAITVTPSSPQTSPDHINFFPPTQLLLRSQALIGNNFEYVGPTTQSGYGQQVQSNIIATFNINTSSDSYLNSTNINPLVTRIRSNQINSIDLTFTLDDSYVPVDFRGCVGMLCLLIIEYEPADKPQLDQSKIINRSEMTKRINEARSGSESAPKSGAESMEQSTDQSEEQSTDQISHSESDGFTSQQVIIKNLQQALSDLESSNPQSGLIQISGAN